MKMKLAMAILGVSICFGFAGLLQAGEQHHVSGVVKAVKTDVKRITISHGPIKTLGMDGMTMDFRVYDPAMLDEVQAGHQVSFMMEVDKKGNFVIMDIEDKGAASGMSMDMKGDGHHHDH